TATIAPWELRRAGASPPPPTPRGEARGGERGEAEKGAPPPQRPNYQALPAFCRIGATLRPSADSDIKIEVWLPESGWNGKLESVGNGAWAGSLSYPAIANTLPAGFATAGTDHREHRKTCDSTPGQP